MWSRSVATSTTTCSPIWWSRDAPYFGRTDGAGAWSTDLPRGRYRVTLWHPRLRESEADLERELTVAEADRAELTLHLTRPLQPAPLADRPHSWDY